MEEQFKRIIKLIRKTGDRFLVLDPNEPENAYAIMNLDEYEKINENKGDLRGLTEDEMIDKINRDIALWKNDSEEEESIDNSAKELSKEDDLEELEEEIKPRKNWSIPSERKKTEDEEDIIEEDRQYLEEINY